MRVRFYVEKRKGKDGKLLTKGRPIFMTVAFHGNRVLISTGKNVDLQWWDPEKQLVKEIYPVAESINLWLKSLEYTAGVVWKSLVSLSEKPGVSDFREEFEKLRPRFSGGFFDVMFLFMEEGSERWSNSSYTKVRAFYNQLRAFQKETGYRVDFNTMDAGFLDRFNTYRREKELADSTFHKMINTLVWFLNWASREGYNVYHDYRRFYRILNKVPVVGKGTACYLEWEELQLFSKVQTDSVRAERARDLFSLMCYTGLKFSELQELAKDDLLENSILVRKAGRTDRFLPLNNLSREIVEKYRNRFYRDNAALPPLSPVTMNKYIRILAKSAGIRRMVRDRGNSEEKKPLCDVLSAGVASTTFIMNALRLEIPIEVISEFTGIHNDQRIKLLKQELAVREMKKFNSL